MHRRPNKRQRGSLGGGENRANVSRELGEKLASHFFCSAAQGFRLPLPGTALSAGAHPLEGGCRRHFSPPVTVFWQRQVDKLGGLISEKSAAAAASPSPYRDATGC